MSQKSKKPKNKEFYQSWIKLLDEITVHEIPMEFIEKIEIDLDSGQTLKYNICELLEVYDVKVLEHKMNIISQKLEPDQLRMFINVDKLAEIVQNTTDITLKDL